MSEWAVIDVCARLGHPDSAMRWIETAFAKRNGWTARGYAIQRSLIALQGTPEIDRFLRAHPRSSAQCPAACPSFRGSEPPA